MDTQKTLQWLAEVSEFALTEARTGNTDVANRLGAHPATQHYLNNVHLHKTMTPEQWAQHYNPYAQQADALREAYEAGEEDRTRDDRLTAIEEGLKALQTQIAQLVESIPAATETPADTKTATKKTAKRQPDPETPAKTDDDEAEDGDAETPDGE